MSARLKVLTYTNPNAADAEIVISRPGWAVMHARPNFKEHGQVLWSDLLAALGHESSALRGRATSNSYVTAYAWLAAGTITDLVVAGAHSLPPRSLIALTHLASVTNVNIWFLYDIETNDERADAVHALALTMASLDDFLDVRAATPPATPVPPPHPFPTVPDVHFLGFCDVAAAVTAPRDARQVHERFWNGREQFGRLLGALDDVNENTVGPLLHELTAGINDISELITVVKGAQAAAFRCGWSLLVDVDRWLQRGTIGNVGGHLDDDALGRIATLYKPNEAAVCVLSALGVAADLIPQVRAGDVADDGTSVIAFGNRIAVPSAASRVLVTQHLYRELLDSSEQYVHGDSSSPVTARWVGGLLRTVTRDTGIVLRTWYASRSDGPKGWAHRLGIAITPLSS